MLTKCRFSPQIFVKVSNIKFHENLFSGRRAEQTDRYDLSLLRRTLLKTGIPFVVVVTVEFLKYVHTLLTYRMKILCKIDMEILCSSIKTCQRRKNKVMANKYCLS
jgi:hypothetical protein